MAKSKKAKAAVVRTGVDGARVKALREKLGYSQPEFQVVAGMDQTRISRIENNRVDIAASYLPVLVAALRTSADYLLRITDDPTPRK